MFVLTYSPLLSDSLVRLYRYMVRFNLEFTPTNVYSASATITGFLSTARYCERFIEELEVIKEMTEAQPCTTLNIQHGKVVRVDGLRTIEWGQEETVNLYSFNAQGMTDRLNRYTRDELVKINDRTEKNFENLVD